LGPRSSQKGERHESKSWEKKWGGGENIEKPEGEKGKRRGQLYSLQLHLKTKGGEETGSEKKGTRRKRIGRVTGKGVSLLRDLRIADLTRKKI